MVRSGESLRGCLVSQSTCRGAMHTNAWLMLVWALEYFWRTACLPLTLSERAKSCLCNLVSSCRTCCNFSAYLHVETHLRSLCVPLWRRGLTQPVCGSASRYHVLRNVGLKGTEMPKDRWTERSRMELEGARSVDTSAMLPSVSAVTLGTARVHAFPIRQL